MKRQPQTAETEGAIVLNEADSLCWELPKKDKWPAALKRVGTIEAGLARIRRLIATEMDDMTGVRDAFTFIKWLKLTENKNSFDLAQLDELALDFYEDTTPVKEIGQVADLIVVAQQVLLRLRFNNRFPELQMMLASALHALGHEDNQPAQSFAERRRLFAKDEFTMQQYFADRKHDLNADMLREAWRYLLNTVGIEALEVEDEDELILGGWDCAESPVGLCVYDGDSAAAMDNCLFCHQPDERK